MIRTRYRLELGLKAGWKIPTDSVARIISPGLLSDDLIDITEGDSPTIIASNGLIEGQDSINMMATLSSVAYDIKDLSDNSIKPLVSNLSSNVDAIGNDLKTTIPAVTDSINHLLASLNSSAEQLAIILNEKNQRHLANVFENADNISQNLAILANSFNDARAQLDLFLKNSNQLVSDNSNDLRQSVIDLRSALTTISDNINAIVYNIDNTSRNLNEFSRQLRDNPGVILRGTTPKVDEVRR